MAAQANADVRAMYAKMPTSATMTVIHRDIGHGFILTNVEAGCGGFKEAAVRNQKLGFAFWLSSTQLTC
jgi:hypothetical protein